MSAPRVAQRLAPLLAFLLAAPAGRASQDFTWLWSALDTMNSYRYAPGVAVAAGRVYLIGGANGNAPGCGAGALVGVQEYDPGTDAYVVKAAMPTARYGAATAEVGGKVFVIGGGTGPEWGGGFTPRGVNEVYDPYFNEWTSRPPPPLAYTPRADAGCAVVNGLVYLIGGWDGATALGVNEAYDPATDGWTPRAPMPTPRVCWAAAAVRGRIYVLGGADAAGAPVANVEAYDPATNTWTARSAMPAPRKGAALAVVNHRIYAIGGSDGAADLTTVEEYNPSTDSWIAKQGLRYARFGAGAAVMNGVVHVFGGCAHQDIERGTLTTICDSPRLVWSVSADGGGSLVDTARAVAVAVGGSVYVAGEVARADVAQGLNWMVNKYAAADGAPLWSLAYDGSASATDAAYGVAADPDGGAVVAGSTDQSDAGEGLNWLVRKYDPGGGLLWSRTYGGPAGFDDAARAVAVDLGDPVVVGAATLYTGGGTAYVAGFEDRRDLLQARNWMVRAIAPDGTLLWSRSYVGFGASDEVANAVTVDRNHDVVAAGTENGNWRIIKYDAAGNELWRQSYLSPGTSTAYGVGADSQGNVYVAGGESAGGGADDWRVQSYGPAGGFLGAATYNSPANSFDDAFALAVDDADRVLVAGMERRNDLSQARNWKIQGYAADGSTLWGRDYNFVNGDDIAFGLAAEPGTASIAVAGNEKSGAVVRWRVRKYARLACLDARLSFGSPQPAVGQTFTVSLTVTNNGEAPALAVSPTLLVDSGTAYVTMVGGPVPALPLTLTATMSQTFTYTFQVVAVGTVVLSGGAAGVYAGLGTPVDAPAEATVSTFPPVVLQPALAAAPNPALVGDTVAVTYTVVNAGSLAVVDVTATLWVTTGASLVALRSGPLSGTVTIPAGAAQAFTWTFSVTGGGLVSFTATAAGLDVNGQPILAAARTAALEATPLKAVLAASPSPGMVGAWVDVRLTVENVGTLPVNDLTVALGLTGTGSVPLLSARSAPAAAAVTLAGRATRTFTWRYNAEEPGDLTLSATASGTDGASGQAVRAGAGAALHVNDPTLRVYPVPFNPRTAVRGTVKFEGLYGGTAVRVYTIGGRLVFEGEMTGGPVEWNGDNREGDPVVPGVYLWATVHPTHGRRTGKLILVRK